MAGSALRKDLPAATLWFAPKYPKNASARTPRIFWPVAVSCRARAYPFFCDYGPTIREMHFDT